MNKTDNIVLLLSHNWHHSCLSACPRHRGSVHNSSSRLLNDEWLLGAGGASWQCHLHSAVNCVDINDMAKVQHEMRIEGNMQVSPVIPVIVSLETQFLHLI